MSTGLSGFISIADFGTTDMLMNDNSIDFINVFRLIHLLCIITIFLVFLQIPKEIQLPSWLTKDTKEEKEKVKDIPVSCYINHMESFINRIYSC